MSSHRPATTIGALPDNVLVEIFTHCRMGEVVHGARYYFPWEWKRLAHVCRTWRHVMFASSRHLRLELLCTHRTPVKKTLGYLPTFPIVISYILLGVEEHNLFAALENRDRVQVINLRVSHTLFERLATVMQEPFPALAHLQFLLTCDTFGTVPPALPDTFLGGFAPRLQTIHIYSIPFPAAPTFLSSAHDLVEVELCHIPLGGYIPPKAMVASLGTLPKLRHLTFKFQRQVPYPERMRLLPITRTVLPALTRFHFMGRFEYFEDFVVQIDVPQLDCLRIEYVDLEVTDFQIPQLCEFLNRSEKSNSSRFIRANISIVPFDAIAIEIDNPSQPSFCLSIQQEAIGQVLSQISALLSNVDRLFIASDPNSEDVGDEIRWLELFPPFTSVKALSVHDVVSRVVHLALNGVTGDRAAEVFPALELLCLTGKDEPAESMKEFAREFVTARQNVGRPVTVVGEEEFEERLNILDISE